MSDNACFAIIVGLVILGFFGGATFSEYTSAKVKTAEIQLKIEMVKAGVTNVVEK